MTALDFEVAGSTRVTSVDEACSFLRDHAAGAVRLCGTGGHQDRIPAPGAAAWLLRLDGLRRIERLDAGDLTCSVQVGVTHTALAEALAPHRVELACDGAGSLGGSFARGEFAPLAPGAASARGLLLGLEGVRSDGVQFKVGARVVKSVAGFDLHKAFVGSRGRLFAATVLHLKLRACPPARVHFERTGLDATAALSLLRALRMHASPPARLVLERAANGACRVAGTVEGAPAHVERMRAEHAMQAIAAAPGFGMRAATGREVIDGFVRPSQIAALLAALPASTLARVSGTGQFQSSLTPAETDDLLAHLPAIGVCAEVRVGTAGRRGQATPVAPSVLALEARVRAALDPRGRFR